MLDLLSVDPICYLFVQAFTRAYDSDFGVGIEQVDDSAGRDLPTA